VLVPVGGGGLIGGIAAWYGGTAKIMGVEPQAAPTLAKALKAGRPVDAETGKYCGGLTGATSSGRVDVSDRASLRGESRAG